jgi:cytochrome P450
MTLFSLPFSATWLSLYLIVLFLAYHYIIYPVFLSPLAKIPNAHPIAPYTPFWILRKRFQRRENRTLYDAHQKYGPVVRLAPNEISVNSVDGLRIVYGGNFDKHDWYPNIFSNYFIDNTFCMTKSEPHRERKRMFANVYSKSYLQNSKEMCDISKSMLFDRLLPIFQSSAEKGSTVEVLELSAAIGMDFTCAYLFGLNAGSDFLRNVDFRKHWLDTFEDTKKYFTWIAEGFVIPLVLLNKIGIKILPNSVFQTLDEMGKWNLEMCKKAQESQTSGKAIGLTRPIVYEQIVQGIEKTDSKLPHPKDMIIASEMLDHILAGHETTAITLTYLMYELSRQPLLQSKLRAEVRTLSPRLNYPADIPEDLPSPRSIDALPLLDAVIQETLRRYPPAAGSEPRVTPLGSTTIGCYSGIPGGVRISANQYTLHRNAKAFPDFETWKPERWLEANQEQKDEMKKWFWAFGSGARMCLGVHFATQGTYSERYHPAIEHTDRYLHRNQARHSRNLFKLRDQHCRRQRD